jgi:hypothetical protein
MAIKTMLIRILPLLAFCLLLTCPACSSDNQNTDNAAVGEHGMSAKADESGHAGTVSPSPTPNPEALRRLMQAADKTISYEHLKKNAGRYAGTKWEFIGKILEIHELEGRTIARISVDAAGVKPMFVTYPFTTEFVEDNRVYVLGELAGEHSYESRAGWNLTIPAIAAYVILKPDEAVKIRVGKPTEPTSPNTPLAHVYTAGEAELFQWLQDQYKMMAADGGTSQPALMCAGGAIARRRPLGAPHGLTENRLCRHDTRGRRRLLVLRDLQQRIHGRAARAL